MREILFRGKLKYDNSRCKRGQWVFNDLVRLQDGNDGKPHIYGYGEVVPETVGQYTGLTDKNGKKIFEGDIVQGLFLYSLPVNSIVSFSDGAFGLLWYRAGVETFWAFTSICNVEYEVIGNIHDNPELLEEGAYNA